MPCQLTETLNICLKLATDLVFPNKRGQTVPENSTAIVPNCTWKRYRTVAFFGREGRCDKIKEEAINRSSLCFLLFFHKTKNIVLCGLSLEPVHQFLPKSFIWKGYLKYSKICLGRKESLSSAGDILRCFYLLFWSILSLWKTTV